jgi:prepilin-type processing-associated H-X9-DG protein
MCREKRRLDDIRKPHALFLWVDRRDYANDIDPDRTACAFSIYVNVTSSNTGHGPDDIGVHHQGGFNACFVDGHVQRIDMNMDPAKPALFIDSMTRGPLKVENFRYDY